MSDRTMEFLDVSLASVATILVDDLDRETVVDVLASAGLEYDVRGETVATRLFPQEGDDPYTVLVDVDTADGVVSLNSTEFLDAYGLAPKATALLEALDATESQSLFTYSLAYDHPLVTFSTLVDHLPDDRSTYRDPGSDRDDRSEVNRAEFPATDGETPPTGDDDWDDRDRPVSRGPSPPRRPHLEVTVDGDVFELYEDGYLLPVDDASRDAVERFVDDVNHRLADSLPEPPDGVDAAELPDGWAGPLVARHPDAGVVADRWAEFADGVPEVPPSTFADDATVASVAETVLDLAVSLLYAVDHLSPEGRALYYDRYRDDESSPLRIPLVDGDGDPRDRDAFLSSTLWTQETERAVAEARREIRDLAPVVESYESQDLESGQVWRYRTGGDDRSLRIVGRDAVGGQFVSLPVWVGEIQGRDGNGGGDESPDATASSTDFAGSNDAGRVIVDGDALVERIDAE